jgi:hypothetical protein
MTAHPRSRVVALTLGLLIALALITGLILIGATLPLALFWGWLVSSMICLGIGIWRRGTAWAAPGFIQLGGAFGAALAWLGVATWWWPLGLVAFGVVAVALANLLPDRLAAGWRSALESSGTFIAGVGAVWEVGQVLTAFLLAAQSIPLLEDDANALRTSFILSSLLLVGGSLLWVLRHRRLLTLIPTAPLLTQLAIALVINATQIGDPSAEGLFALTLLVAALACHVGTYPLRFIYPDLAPGETPRPWRLLLQRRRRSRAAEALKTLRSPDAWWLCFLLDGFALLLALLAIAPVADHAAAGSPNSGPLLIVLTAGVLLSSAVAYWQQAPWLVLLAGCFLAADVYALGLFTPTPASIWPLLYFAVTTGVLGLAVWLRSFNKRAWAWPTLLVALGAGFLALLFALARQNLVWGLGMALALAAAALLTIWGWRTAQEMSHHR